MFLFVFHLPVYCFYSNAEFTLGLYSLSTKKQLLLKVKCMKKKTVVVGCSLSNSLTPHKLGIRISLWSNLDCQTRIQNFHPQTIDLDLGRPFKINISLIKSISITFKKKLLIYLILLHVHAEHKNTQLLQLVTWLIFNL